jgi:hypothetical protein
MNQKHLNYEFKEYDFCSAKISPKLKWPCFIKEKTDSKYVIQFLGKPEEDVVVKLEDLAPWNQLKQYKKYKDIFSGANHFKELVEKRILQISDYSLLIQECLIMGQFNVRNINQYLQSIKSFSPNKVNGHNNNINLNENSDRINYNDNQEKQSIGNDINSNQLNIFSTNYDSPNSEDNTENLIKKIKLETFFMDNQSEDNNSMIGNKRERSNSEEMKISNIDIKKMENKFMEMCGEFFQFLIANFKLN